MSEKVPKQKELNAPKQENLGGITMAPPPFQLAAGDENPNAAAKQLVSENEEKEASGGYKTYDNGTTIVTIPENASGTLPILVIVGGISYANKTWMKGQTPPNLFQTHILSFSNHSTGYTKGVRPGIEKAMEKESVKGNYKAMLGFSKGGERVNLAKADEAWSFLGMIDPSVPDGGGTYPCPIYHVWDLWGSNTLENDNRSELHNKVISGAQAGESVRDTKAKHADMPKRWFELYGSKL